PPLLRGDDPRPRTPGAHPRPGAGETWKAGPADALAVPGGHPRGAGRRHRSLRPAAGRAQGGPGSQGEELLRLDDGAARGVRAGRAGTRPPRKIASVASVDTPCGIAYLPPPASGLTHGVSCARVLSLYN